MTKIRTITTLMGIAFLAGGSVEAFAVANVTSARQLAKLMHKEVNAVVSRDEFV